MKNIENKSELKVNAIKEGTVLDHIPVDQLFRVIDILKLRECGSQMTFGTNLESKLLGKKAIIKVAGRYFAPDEINKIALVAPQAKINVIKDFEVVEKKVIEIPSEVSGIVKCVNPKCITNHQPIRTRFSVHNISGSGFKLHCHYCEKDTDSKEISILSE